MHLDIGLPLLTELEQQRKAFWQKHDHQHKSLNQNRALSPEHNSPQLQRHILDPKQTLDSTNNHSEPTHLSLSQSQDQKTTCDCPSGSQHHNKDHGGARTDSDHCCLTGEHEDISKDESHGSSRDCNKSVSRDSNEDGTGTCEHVNTSGCPKDQNESCQVPQVDNVQPGRRDRPQRMCGVAWDKSTEDRSFL